MLAIRSPCARACGDSCGTSGLGRVDRIRPRLRCRRRSWRSNRAVPCIAADMAGGTGATLGASSSLSQCKTLFWFPLAREFLRLSNLLGGKLRFDGGALLHQVFAGEV
jgi:hypothetical protein